MAILQSKRLKVKVGGVQPRYRGKLREAFACPGNNFSIGRIKDGLSVLGFRCKRFLLFFCVLCVCVRACVRACVLADVRACVRVCVCVCVCVSVLLLLLLKY